MSRWLKSVNNLLETLDGQVEDVVDDTQAAFDDLREQFDTDDYDSDDDESEYESEELESELEEEEVVWEEAASDDAEEPLLDTNEEVQSYEDDEIVSAKEESEQMKPLAVADAESKLNHSPPSYQVEPVTVTSVDTEQEVGTDGSRTKTPASSLEPKSIGENAATRTAEPEVKHRPPPPPVPQLPVESKGLKSEDTAANAPPSSTGTDEVSKVMVPPPPPPPKSVPLSGLASSTKGVDSPPASGYASAPNTTTTATASQGTNNSAIQQQLKRSNRELKKVQGEARQLRKHVVQLNTQLETAEAEMAAQRDELQRAAERMEKDRARNNEEREDLLDEHDEELENMKEHYEKLLDEQKEHYEDQVDELQDRLSIEEEKRMQEGGDWTKELEDSVQRERDALKRLGELKEEHAALQSKTTKLEAQQNALQKKLESSAQNIQQASQREREADDKLDAALSLHSRQLSQRQTREAELERMIADLGAALTVARQKEQNRGTETTNTTSESESGYRKQHELAVDELETVKVQLSMESQRCEALRQELHDISQERTEETFEAQARQQQHDREVADLNTTIARLEGTLRSKKKTPSAPGETTGEFTPAGDEVNVRQLKEAEELKGKIASLSEQLIRSQQKNERSKSEVLALKNRLQASTSRAENAEQALAAQPSATTSQLYQAEAGTATYGTGMRRRIKGGRGRSTSGSVRSIRSALNMQPGRVSDGTEQVAQTIDAVDSFLVETGSFMRHEPLARLAFLLYLIILHLWAFCLVLFHAHSFEKEHGDFGSMSVPGEDGHP